MPSSPELFLGYLFANGDLRGEVLKSVDRICVVLIIAGKFLEVAEFVFIAWKNGLMDILFVIGKRCVHVMHALCKRPTAEKARV